MTVRLGRIGKRARWNLQKLAFKLELAPDLPPGHGGVIAKTVSKMEGLLAVGGAKAKVVNSGEYKFQVIGGVAFSPVCRLFLLSSSPR
jgi:hypothetical protein